MPEISENDLISKGALEAPGKLANELDKVVGAVERIIAASKKSESVIAGSKSTSKVATETEKLTKAQKELSVVQEKAAKIAKVVWLSNNEVAESQKRAAQAMKATGTVISDLDKKMAAAANSATQLGKAQKESNTQSSIANTVYKAESGSLQDLTNKRILLQNAIKSQKVNQKEDLDLLKRGIIDRQEYNKRLAESEAAISRQKAAIQTLNQQVKNHILTNSALGNEYKKLTIQLESARIKYKDLAASGTASNAALKAQQKVFEDLNKKVTTIDNAVGQFQRNVGNYPRTFGIATQAVTRFLGAFGLVTGLALFAKTIKEVVGLNVEFEASNSKLQAVMGATKQEISGLREQQIRLAETTLYTADQYANLQIELAKLGFPTKAIEQMTESTANAAIAMGSDLGRQAELTGSILHAYNLEASQTDAVNDQLSKSTTTTALDFEKLATALPYVSSSAKLLGFNLSETLALMGQLSNTGLQASTIGTSLRSIFLSLADSSSNLSKKVKEPVRDLPSFLKLLKQLKDENIDLGEALELSDKRSVSAFASLVAGADKVEVLSKTIHDATGFTKQLADTVTDNLKGDFILLSSAAQSLARELGENLDSSLRSVVRSLITFIGIIREIPKFIKENKGLITSLVIALVAFNGATITSTALTLKDIAVKKIQVLWNRTATLSFRALGASIYAALGPLGLLLLAVSAVGAAISIYDKNSRRAMEVEKQRAELQKGLANQIDNVTKAQKSLDVSIEEWLKLTDAQKKSVAEQIEFTVNHTKVMLARLKVQKIQLAEGAKELTLWQQLKVKASFIFGLGGAIAKQAYETENVSEATGEYDEQIQKLETEIEALTHILDDNTAADKENAVQKKKSAEDTRKAQLELEKFRLEQQIRTLEEIQKNENESLEDRLAATQKIEILRAALVENERKRALLEEIKSEAQRTLIAEKAEAGRTEVKKQAAKERTQITKEETEAALKEVEEEQKKITERILEEQQRRIDAEVGLIQEEVLQGRMGREKAEKEIAKIKIKADQDLLKLTIKNLRELLNAERYEYYEKRKKLIEDSEMSDVDKQAALVELTKQSSAEQLEIEKKLYNARKDLQDNLYQNQKGRYDDEIEALGKLQSVYETWGSAISSLFDSITQRRLQNYELEEKKLEERTARELELAGDNEKAKKEIEKRAEAQRKVLEQKKIQDAVRFARFEKIAAVISAGLAGSLAVLNQLAKGDPYTAFARAAAAGVLAGIQIAAIIAKPVPKYQHGGRHGGGLAQVSEEGPELFTTPSGDQFLTPEKKTVTYLPPGEITPHRETMQQLALSGLAASNHGDRPDHSKEMLGELKGINKSLSKKPPVESLAESGPVLIRVLEKKGVYKKMIRDYSIGKWW